MPFIVEQNVVEYQTPTSRKQERLTPVSTHSSASSVSDVGTGARPKEKKSQYIRGADGSLYMRVNPNAEAPPPPVRKSTHKRLDFSADLESDSEQSDDEEEELIDVTEDDPVESLR
jgi:hypothetical protein